MINIQLHSYLKNAAPEDVFYAMSDREGLKSLLPRMRKVEFHDRGINSETVVMHIAIGQTFGTIRCEGTLSWDEPRELTFTVHTPLPVETRWTLNPAVNGTELNIDMQLELEPLLGPMARFVPKQAVEDMMVKELTHAINRIAQRTKDIALRDQEVAA